MLEVTTKRNRQSDSHSEVVVPTPRTLNQDEEAEIEQFLLMALEWVPLPQDVTDIDARDPALLVMGVSAVVDAVRSGEVLPEGVDLGSLATGLGVLFGEELCRVVQWEWRYLVFDDGFEGLAVARSDGSLAVLPIHYLYGLLSEPEMDNTVGILFGMIRNGDTPEAKPEDWRILS